VTIFIAFCVLCTIIISLSVDVVVRCVFPFCSIYCIIHGHTVFIYVFSAAATIVIGLKLCSDISGILSLCHTFIHKCILSFKLCWFYGLSHMFLFHSVIIEILSALKLKQLFICVMFSDLSKVTFKIKAQNKHFQIKCNRTHQHR
jgi:hypothetical protein